MYPARTVSVALFAWPRCIDEFAFDWQRIRNLVYSWRVRVCWSSGHWNESDFSYALAVESGPMRKNKRELLSPEVLAFLRNQPNVEPCKEFQRVNIDKFFDLRHDKCEVCLPSLRQLDHESNVIRMLAESRK